LVVYDVADLDEWLAAHRVRSSADGFECERTETAKRKGTKRSPGLRDSMDRTGRVDGPYKRLMVARQAETIRKEPPPYPAHGPYRVIVADPPWPYEKDKIDPSHRATYPYPQMSIEDVCGEASTVQAIAHDDCILWLWTTNYHMREAFTVLDAWGFSFRTILTWVKDSFGRGDWLRGQTEHCLLAIRGRPVVELTNQSTVLQAPAREHSAKPDEFYRLVESLCPAPGYAELFQRTPRPGWDGHGDEVRRREDEQFHVRA
jgi:N6-adenosine-specific RNA methylase IME4